MKVELSNICAVLGLVLLTAGAWLIQPAYGFIVAGAGLSAFAYLLEARSG